MDNDETERRHCSLLPFDKDTQELIFQERADVRRACMGLLQKAQAEIERYRNQVYRAEDLVFNTLASRGSGEASDRLLTVTLGEVMDCLEMDF